MRTKFLITLLCVAFLFPASLACAVDFKISGNWLMGLSLSQTNPIRKYRIGTGKHRHPRDVFHATQRLRLQIEAAVSEQLSGTVAVQIGNQAWGRKADGAALGTGDDVIALRFAYLDWMIPDSSVKVRMGLQSVILPNAAGGPAIMDANVAGIVASAKLTDSIGLTALWARPYNDNFAGYTTLSGYKVDQGAFDNMDLFGLLVPITQPGYSLTPWAMYGIRGKNALSPVIDWNFAEQDFLSGGRHENANHLAFSMYPYPGMLWATAAPKKTWGSMFWAGLPVTISAADPWHFELDFNYGYVEAMERFLTVKPSAGIVRHASSKREGWLIKGLAEYQLDWVKPGIFGWYASGDDSNPGNGSERMPTLKPNGAFTSFLGNGNLGWMEQNYAQDYAGTWGIGVQAREMAFIEDISHTFRTTLWGGTNDPSLVKYMQGAFVWADGWGSGDSPYLTTNDYLLEFNLVSRYRMYENFSINMEFDYVANFMDVDTWKKAGFQNTSFSRQDVWKVQIAYMFSF